MNSRHCVPLLLLLAAAGAGCDDFEDPAPPPPTAPTAPPSQFDITGRWDGISDQGRPLRFDVNGRVFVVNGTLSLHHDCSGGRLVLQLRGFGAEVDADAFTTTFNWRIDEPDGKFYVGTLTFSGQFQGNNASKGGWVNSITDKQVDNLGVCGPASGNWDATKS